MRIKTSRNAVHVGGNHDRGGHYRPVGSDRDPQLHPGAHHVATECVHQQPAPIDGAIQQWALENNATGASL